MRARLVGTPCDVERCVIRARQLCVRAGVNHRSIDRRKLGKSF